MDLGQSQFIVRGSARFPSLLPEPTAARESGIGDMEMSNLGQLLLSALITNKYEQGMIAKTLKDVHQKKK